MALRGLRFDHRNLRQLRVRPDSPQRYELPQLLRQRYGRDMSEPVYSMGDGLRRMYLESDYDTVEEFLESLKCPDIDRWMTWDGDGVGP